MMGVCSFSSGLLVLVIACLAGCIPDPLPVDSIPAVQPKLVIGSQVIPGQGLVVYVTRTVGALEAGWNSELQPLLEKIAVMDAVVTLEHDGEVDTLVHQAYGVYAGASGDVVGNNTYTLRVKSVLWGEVEATTTAPAFVPLTSADAELYLTGYDSLASVTYGFEDPPAQNWYMINVQKISAADEIDKYLNPRVFTRLVSDDGFNGQPFSDQFNVVFQDYSQGDSVLVMMSSISEDYFNYLTLRNDSRYSLAGFASEPLNFPTNVKGGYGYFNLHVPDARVFVLE